MKSEKLKIQITLFNQRPRAKILAQLAEMLARARTCIFHFSLFTFHFSKSLATPLQVRTKSVANPIPEWEIEGRQWVVNANRDGDYKQGKGWGGQTALF